MSGALTGVRVVELAGIGPAQLGAMLLADLGADVVRIDRPGEGERDASGELLSRGRRSVALDLKDPEDVERALRLADGADVFVDPFRPGVAERIGVGPEVVCDRNPRIVYARMTGWGQDGPLARAAGHDINYIAIAGALEAIGPAGEVPPVPLNVIGDFGGGGMLMAFGVTAALLERERSGRGQVLDVAMVDGVAALLQGVLQIQAMGEWEPGRARNWLQGAAPWYRAYRTADDGFVTVGALEGKFYALLLERLELDPADWPQWDTGRWQALSERLERAFARRTLDEWAAELEGSDACFAPAVELARADEHPHVAARRTYVRRDGHLQAAPVPRFSRTPGAIGRTPPWPGQHSSEVLSELEGGKVKT